VCLGDVVTGVADEESSRDSRPEGCHWKVFGSHVDPIGAGGQSHVEAVVHEQKGIVPARELAESLSNLEQFTCAHPFVPELDR